MPINEIKFKKIVPKNGRQSSLFLAWPLRTFSLINQTVHLLWLVVAVLNFFSFTIIAGSYLWMYFVARNTQRAVQRESHTSESSMAFRMTLLVATDAACWIPIIILGFLSLAGFTMPPQVSYRNLEEFHNSYFFIVSFILSIV